MHINILAKKAYEAHSTSLTAPGSGVPSCFSPLDWERLLPVVREAYIEAFKMMRTLVNTNPRLEVEDYAAGGYNVMAKIMAQLEEQPVRPWSAVSRPLRNAWLASAKFVADELKKDIN